MSDAPKKQLLSVERRPITFIVEHLRDMAKHEPNLARAAVLADTAEELAELQRKIARLLQPKQG